MDVPDLIISIAYFSIPIQILVSLLKYPSLTGMQAKIVVLLILFALFICLCGAGHLLRCLEKTDTQFFKILNIFTSIVSLITAVYLLPLIPNLMGAIEKSMQDLVKLNCETSESKSKLFTFMAFLCHEIRNPLFAITASASFLSDTDMTEEQEVGVGSIQDASLLMLRLGNDVLDLSKIDAGKLELEQRDFNLHRLFENLNCNMNLQILQKSNQKVKFDFKMSKDVPKLVFGDSTRFLQIIYNLLSNSSKFTNQGHIRLKVCVCQSTNQKYNCMLAGYSSHDNGDCGAVGMNNECFDLDNCCKKAVDDDDGFSSHDPSAWDLERGNNASDSPPSCECHDKVVLSIIVSDTGIGIPTERIKTIFEPFSQAKLSDYREHGGTGLGLSIVYRLVEAMNGSIKVVSKVGEGTHFFLKIPIRVSSLDYGQEAGQQDIPEFPADINDMTDPLLTCRRLPVYSSLSLKKVGAVLSDGNDDDGAVDKEQRKAKEEQDNSTASVPCASSSSSSSLLSSLLSENNATIPTQNEGIDHAKLSTMVMIPNKRKTSAKPRLPPFESEPLSSVVLVVDDNCINRKLIGKMLSFCNVEYRTAGNGVEAIQAINSSRNVTGDPEAPYYKIIFMDLSMPIMDGYEAIDRLRKNGSQIPIIALTANALSKERTRALDLGANEFHTKPILREDLHTLCSRFLLRDGQVALAGGGGNEGNTNGSHDKINNNTNREHNTPLKQQLYPPSPRLESTPISMSSVDVLLV